MGADRRPTGPLARVGAVLDRRRVDGRLPDSVSDLLWRWLRLRVRTPVIRAAAAARPPVGAALDARARGSLGRSGGRRWLVSGDAPCSLFDLAHVQAGRVVEVLQAAGVEPFVVDADHRRLSFGVDIRARSRAWSALSGLADGHWYLTWRRGRRSGTVLLGAGRGRRRARRAERWEVHRWHRAGRDALAGRDEAVELTFWTPGAHQRLEQVAVRGLQRFPEAAPRTTERVAGRSYPGVAAFPVERALMRFDEPIDVVYTWVDGSDPQWRAEFEAWSRREDGPAPDEQAIHPSRFRSRDELRYSLRSLWLHAGWVRRIHLVTSGQVPAWLQEDDRLRVVPHSEIFPAGWLPTFSSHAIEARLHHIDGLAEHFVYFNDDLFVGTPLTPHRFFTPNGLARFVPGEAWVPLASDAQPALAVDTAARNGQRLIEQTFGRRVERKLHHAPHPQRRSVLREIEQRFPAEVERTARNRFRHADDLSIPSSFAPHYGFCTGRAVIGDLEVAYINLENRRLRIFLDRLLLGRDVETFCLNETETEGHSDAVDETVAAFLEAYFPLPSPWER